MFKLFFSRVHRLNSFHRGLNWKLAKLVSNKQYLFRSLRRNPSSTINPEFFILFQLYIQTHNSPLLPTGFAPSGTKIWTDISWVLKELWIKKMIDFVPCVNFSEFENIKGLLLILTVFSFIQLPFITNCWHYFLLEGFNLMHSVFVRLFDS